MSKLIPEIERFGVDYEFNVWGCLDYLREDGSIDHEAFNYYGPVDEFTNHVILVKHYSSNNGKLIVKFRFKKWKK